MGDNNGMPQDSPGPLSDPALSLANHDTPSDPTPGASGRSSTDSTSGTISTTGGRKHEGQQASTSSQVQSASRQAAHMDSVAEAEQAKKNKQWHRNSALQTIALDSDDLPASTSSSQKVGPSLGALQRLGDNTAFTAS